MKTIVIDGVVFCRTKIGEPVFQKADAADADGSIRFMDWSSYELRAIADYMDKNPHQRCMSDGSGMLSLTGLTHLFNN